MERVRTNVFETVSSENDHSLLVGDLLGCVGSRPD